MWGACNSLGQLFGVPLRVYSHAGCEAQRPGVCDCSEPAGSQHWGACRGVLAEGSWVILLGFSRTSWVLDVRILTDVDVE